MAAKAEDNGALYPVKYAIIDAATSGDNTLVAAVSGKKSASCRHISLRRAR